MTNNSVTAGGPEGPRRWVGGVSQGERLARTGLGVDPDNAFVRRLGKRCRLAFAVHAMVIGGTWSCLLKACHLVHLPKEAVSVQAAGLACSKNHGEGDSRVLTP